MLFLSTFLYCIASALIPVVNAEAYVAGVGALVHGGQWQLIFVALTAAAGQMVGKIAYFLLGRSSLNWPFIKKKLESPRWKASFEKWQGRLGGNRVLASFVLLASALFGFPPFAILSVLAGQMRVPLPLFLVTGFIGRFGRFAAILGIAGFVSLQFGK
ncbi:VTT domain-containing protein [Tenggerimyces flavus]|uniref:VTT domain-containing protein n=1 Tax=Tenggerimyces flavus TaxID=1708749 RepID=A0ABV7YAU3_9ACTN|nr:VTT domain-containing protein [Tenggerimyces flavus]MBM7783697.1 membrane protein YqaA with SNARE-associated domain [Tenggerimyces flavus]